MTREQIIKEAFVTLRSAMPQVTYSSCDTPKMFGEMLAHMHAEYIKAIVDKLSEYIDNDPDQIDEREKRFNESVSMLQQAYKVYGMIEGSYQSSKDLFNAIISTHHIGRTKAIRWVNEALDNGALTIVRDRTYLLNRVYKPINLEPPF